MKQQINNAIFWQQPRKNEVVLINATHEVGRITSAGRKIIKIDVEQAEGMNKQVTVRRDGEAWRDKLTYLRYEPPPRKLRLCPGCGREYRSRYRQCYRCHKAKQVWKTAEPEKIESGQLTLSFSGRR